MNRKHHLHIHFPHFRMVSSGKHVARWMLTSLLLILLMLGAWGLFVVDTTGDSPASYSSSGYLMQQMIWNPSPK